MIKKHWNLKKRTVAAGIFYAELNDFLRAELEHDVSEASFAIGYAGVEIRRSAMRIEIIIRATRTQPVVGEKGQRIRELQLQIKNRFQFGDSPTVELFAERVTERALCSLAQAEAVKYKLLEGSAVRRACYRALRFIMESKARGCEIVVSGKLRGQRAKAMKFKQGYMISSGDAKNYYIDRAVKHVKLRQGVLGIKVKIMLPHDPTGQIGPKKPLPDKIEILEPKQFKEYVTPVGIPYGVQQEVEQPPVDPENYDETVGRDDYVAPDGAGVFDPAVDPPAQEYGQPPPQDYRQQPQAEPQMGYQSADVQQQPSYQTPAGDGEYFGQ